MLVKFTVQMKKFGLGLFADNQMSTFPHQTGVNFNRDNHKIASGGAWGLYVARYPLVGMSFRPVHI